MIYLCSHEYTTEYYLLAGPCLCSEDYSSRNIHCHHPSVSEFWYTLESYTVGILASGLREELREEKMAQVGEKDGGQSIV